MMAALVRHVLLKTGQHISTNAGAIATGTRCFASKTSKAKRQIKNAQKCNRTETGRFDSVAESVASKGYLRSYKEYTPKPDVKEHIWDLCEATDTPKHKQPFINLQQKAMFLILCFEHFNHSIPNSQLHEIETIDDVIRFYKTPVKTILPLDAMKTIDLPENLHIQHDYVRFHPETDIKFNGKTAFPKSSTLVTGLKYRSKYRGHIAKTSWP